MNTKLPPADLGEEQDSQGLGPAEKPEPKKEPELRWFDIPGKPGMQINSKGVYRYTPPGETVGVPVPWTKSGWPFR